MSLVDHYLKAAHGWSNYEISQFYQWAFGPNYGSIPITSLDDAWNERHKDLLLIKGTDLFHDTIMKIAELYKQASTPTIEADRENREYEDPDNM